MLTSTDGVLTKARELALKKKPVVAVAGAEDPDVLSAVRSAHRDEIVDVILVGNAGRIRNSLAELELSREPFEIVEAEGVRATVARAVELCTEGRAQILMKGKVPTPDLMKALLNPKAGLRQGRLLSHCAILEIPGYRKLLSFSDGGVVVSPDFQQKLGLVENAVRVSRMIGVSDPKVAILGVMNEPDPDFPSTLEAAALARACYVKGICNFVEGPLTLRAAFGEDQEVEWRSEVIGNADILIGHSIEEINISVKAVVNLRGATFMGVITGAKVPLSLVSRSDPPRNKLAALALAAVIAGEEQS